MERGIRRRVFVGSVVAGLPLLATSGARLLAQTNAAAHLHTGAGSPDPLLEHLARQLAAIHNAMRRDVRGEHARAFATQLRTMAVYSRQIDLDAKLKSALASRIDQEGRDAVLYQRPDRAHLRAELKRYGADVDERFLVETELNYAQRGAALDRLMHGGVSASWERLAATLDRIAPALDRRAAQVVRVGRQQPDAAWYEGYCRELWNQYTETQFLAAAICASVAIPVIGVAFVAPCAAYQLAALLYAFLYAGDCWNVQF